MTSEAVFIQVGALADGFAPHGNLLATASLPAGENFTFYVAGSEPQQLVIEDEQTLSWNGKRAPWRATALRPDILFIDFLDPERDNASISAVCNLTQRNATLVYGQLPDEAAARLDAFSRVEQGLPLTAVEVRFVFARLDAQPGPLPGFTDALIGMRNQYTYSPTERYEHIYLNDNFYAWQCLDGVEKGLADVDRCHYVQVAEDLYLFVWREKIIPTLGVILIDLQQMRTDGKIMGYQGSDFGALSNFPVGASAKILNVTRHQDQAAWVDGEWKLRRLVPRGLTAGDAPWQLFNLHDDPLETHDVAAEHPDRVKAMSEAYEAFAKRTMVTRAQGKMIDYVGIDSKTGRYLAVDPATMKPVPAPQAIPVSEIH